MIRESYDGVEYIYLYAAPVPSVPEGYRLVPIDPTKEMLEAGQTEWLDSAGADPSFNVYRAMLAAAPKPGEQK